MTFFRKRCQSEIDFPRPSLSTSGKEKALRGRGSLLSWPGFAANSTAAHVIRGNTDVSLRMSSGKTRKRQRFFLQCWPQSWPWALSWKPLSSRREKPMIKQQKKIFLIFFSFLVFQHRTSFQKECRWIFILVAIKKMVEYGGGVMESGGVCWGYPLSLIAAWLVKA